MQSRTAKSALLHTVHRGLVVYQIRTPSMVSPVQISSKEQPDPRHHIVDLHPKLMLHPKIATFPSCPLLHLALLPCTSQGRRRGGHNTDRQTFGWTANRVGQFPRRSQSRRSSTIFRLTGGCGQEKKREGAQKDKGEKKRRQQKTSTMV